MNNKMVIKIANEALELSLNKDSLLFMNLILPSNIDLDFDKFIQLTK
jgi:hypothetical protein